MNFNEDLSTGQTLSYYRNFGNLNVWGSDLGAEFLLPMGFSMAGTYSYVNKNLFPKSEVGGVQDISLNAPANKHSFAVRYERKQRMGSRASRASRRRIRRSVVHLSAHQAVHAARCGLNWRPSFLNNVLLAVNGTNITNKKHQEFAQGGLIGRLIITRLSVTF